MDSPEKPFEPATRIFGVVACEAPVVALIRRGPKKRPCVNSNDSSISPRCGSEPMPPSRNALEWKGYVTGKRIS